MYTYWGYMTGESATLYSTTAEVAAVMPENQYKWMRSAGQAASIGFVLVISIIIGYFFGSWLDRVFGTTPWLMLVFTIMGIVAGFIEVIRIAKDLLKDE
jgi:F0F1-type ATP synthase assembly protein I